MRADPTTRRVKIRMSRFSTRAEVDSQSYFGQRFEVFSARTVTRETSGTLFQELPIWAQEGALAVKFPAVRGRRDHARARHPRSFEGESGEKSSHRNISELQATRK